MSSTSQNSEQNWVTWSAMMRAVLVRAIPWSITRYGSDPDGRQYTQEQVDAVRRQLNMKAWTVHEVLYLLEALSPMLAISSCQHACIRSRATVNQHVCHA